MATPIDQIIGSINAVYPVLWLGYPVAILLESSKRLQNFHEQHQQNKVLVEDKYDDQNFNKVVKPLYAKVNQILVEKMVLSGNRPPRATEALLREYEAKKELLLNTQDISQFEESLEFAQMQKEVINAKKSKYNYDKLYKSTQKSLIWVVALSVIQTLVAVSFFVFQILGLTYWQNASVYAWGLLALLAMAVFAKNIYDDVRLKNYVED